MFTPVCKLADLQEEGELYRYDVAEKPLLVLRFRGSIYVANSICTHEEADLSLGMFGDGVVTCPLHGAKFQVIDGKVILGPDGSPASEIPSLKVYPVKVENGEVYIDLG